jgi:hypothetical protein
MNTPKRSAVIARALASRPVELPENFAAQVAALAEGRARAKFLSWSDVALSGAFIVMLGLCMAGWSRLASQELVSAEWLGKFVSVLAAQPWLFVAVAGLVVIQALSFGRRARI